MYPDIWHNLQRLMNFTYEITMPPDKSWGTYKDGKWTGMIRQLVEDEVDIAPAEFTVTHIRSTSVDFLVPIAESHQRLFISNPAESFNWRAYIEPVLLEAWGGVGLAILVLPPILAFLMLYNNEPSRAEFTLSKCYCFFPATMVMWAWSATPNSYHSRIGFYVMLLAGTLLYYHWEAMLISYLAVRTIVLPFNSLEELAYQTDFNVLVRPGTSYLDTFRYGNTETLQKIWKERIEPYVENYPKGKAEINKYTIETGFALFDNYYATVPYDEYLQCKMIDIPVQYFPVQFAYTIQKDSPYFPAFWYQMSKLKENGAFHITQNRYKAASQVCPDYSGAPINFGQCFTAFLLLIAGIIIAFCWFIFEKICPKVLYIKWTSAINKGFRKLFKWKEESNDVLKIDDTDMVKLQLNTLIKKLESDSFKLAAKIYKLKEKTTKTDQIDKEELKTLVEDLINTQESLMKS